MFNDSRVVRAAAGAVAAVVFTATPAHAQTARARPPSPADFQEVPHVRQHTGRLLVRPKRPTPGSPDAAATLAAARARLDPWRIRTLDPMDIHVLLVPAGSTEFSLATSLLATGDYEYAEPDWLVYPLSLEPSDTAWANDWHLRKIEAPAAWSRTTGDGSLTIAFVDTGIDLTHPDLAPLLVSGLNSASYVTQAQGGDVSDVNGHGTGVAGAAAAMGNNSSGGCGVGWNFPIMPIRASNSPSGGAFFSDVLYGAVWAAANGARVVSVSFAGIESSSVEPTASAIKNNYGGLLVWGAGNSGLSLDFDRPDTTVVGSTDQNDVLASDSNFGPAIDVVAPGVSVFVPVRGGGWTWASGTSYSTPVASGVLALLWSANPLLSPDQAMSALYQSCDDLGAAGRDPTFGWGRVNAARALSCVLPPARTDTDLYPATAFAATIPTLRARYYSVPSVDAPVTSWVAGPTSTVDDLAFSLPAGSTFPGAPPASNLGAVFVGAVTVPAPGPYTFTLRSNDASRLFVDDRLVVDNGGAHTVRWRAGSIGLFAGPHTIRCEYATAAGPITLVLRARGRGIADAPVASALLTHSPSE